MSLHAAKSAELCAVQ